MTSRANCCVAGCNSMYKNNPELTFHHFPSDSQKIEHVDEFGIVSTVYRKKMWEIKLKMEKRVTRNMRVCSRHFVEQDFITPSDWGYKKRYLKKNVIPSTNLPVSSIITKSINYKQEEKNKRIEWLIKRRQSNVNQLPGTSNVQQKSDNTFSDIDGAEVLLELGNIYRQEFAVEVDISEETPKFEKIFVDAGTQTDNHKELKNVEVQVNTSWSSISDFIQTEKALNILTGLSSFSLLFLLMKLFPLSKKDSRCQRVSVKNRILLVFLKFKLDMTYSALGVFFGGISVPTFQIFWSILCICHLNKMC